MTGPHAASHVRSWLTVPWRSPWPTNNLGRVNYPTKSYHRRLWRRDQEPRHLRIMVTGLLPELSVDVHHVVAAWDQRAHEPWADQQVIEILGVALEDVAIALIGIEPGRQIAQVSVWCRA